MKYLNIIRKLGISSALVLSGLSQANAAITVGSYTVGSGGTYATLGDAIADIGTMSGNIELNILPGTYSGTGWQLTIPALSGSSSSNRLIIQPSSSAVTISGAGTSTDNYIIKLDGAAYVSIKNITIENTDQSYGRIIDFEGAAAYDSVIGCTLTGPSITDKSTDLAVIASDDASSISNVVITGNTIQNGSVGIYWWASSATTADDVFSHNTFQDNYYSYIYTAKMSNATIEHNTCSISNLSDTHYDIYMEDPDGGCSIQYNSLTTYNYSSLYGIYMTNGNNSSASAELIISHNTLDLTTTDQIQGIYLDNCKTATVEHNTLTQNASYMNYGIDFNYGCDNFKCNNNTLDLTSSAANMGIYAYWVNNGLSNAYAEVNNNTLTAQCDGDWGEQAFAMQYINYNATDSRFTCNNNTIGSYCTNSYAYNYGCFDLEEIGDGTGNTDTIMNNSVEATSPNYLYIPNFYSVNNALVKDNTFTGTITDYGYLNVNGPNNSTNLMFRDNTFNLEHTSWGGAISNGTAFYNGWSSASGDSVINNTYNVNCPDGAEYDAQIYNWSGYNAENTFNINTYYSGIYHQFSYPVDGMAYRNKFNLYSEYGDVNGMSTDGSSSSTGTWIGNTFDMNSNYGTIYGYGGISWAYPGNDKFISNIFVANSINGATYMFTDNGNANSDMYFFNNTFHSNSTGYTNYLVNKQGSSTSGNMYMYNNIFSKSDVNNTDPLVYIIDTTDWKADYNLYYAPGNMDFVFSATGTASRLQDWRNNTNRDMNSLIYDPGYTDAANKNLHPQASDPRAWAVNGRGMQLDGDTLDADGIMRPKTRQDGVPDLGAYEITPTSTPPPCDAIPAVAVAGTTQYFLFGQDTAAAITWGPVAPATTVMRQYTGEQAGAPMPAIVGRSFLWLDLNTGGVYELQHKPVIYYKDPQLGTVSNETNAKIANSSNGSPWVGYNYTNAKVDSLLNWSFPSSDLDSVGKYTIVENARIGIRCIVNPTHVKVSNITAFDADIDWDAVFLPTGYQVLVDNIPGTPSSGAAATFSSNNSLHLNSLTENTDYYVHVRTICGPKDTSGWTTVHFTTLITCHTPDVKILKLTQNNVVVYWDTIQTATKYEYVIQNAPTPVPTVGTPVYTPSLQFPLSPGKDYYVFVRAYCNSIYPQSEWGMVGFSTFPTAINTISGASIGLSAYPNPVTNMVTVELAGKIDGEANITITDVTGKLISSMSVNNNKTEIDMSRLASGVYQLKYSDRSHVDVMKITKQ